MKITAILLLGGKGVRFGSPVPKQFLNLSGKKVYQHTLAVFKKIDLIEEIILVCPENYLKTIKSEVCNEKTLVVSGGADRQESSFNGLLACSKGTTHVVIHDGARPFVSEEIIHKNIQALSSYDAVNTCISSNDTIVHSTNKKIISSIPDRTQYLRGQTPQSFRYSTILNAHKNSSKVHATDDCSLINASKNSIFIVDGCEKNLKITTELDLFVAEQLLKSVQNPTGKLKRSLLGKTFAITGATGGIGSAIAKLLSANGAKVFPLSLTSKQFAVDLTRYEEVKTIFNSLGPIDGLINCVGFLFLKSFYHLTQKEIDILIKTNLHALLYSCHTAQVKKGGHIINLASSAFSRGRKYYALYSSAKAAVVNFTQGLAEERKDLFINVVIPQRTATRMRTKNFPNENPQSLIQPSNVAKKVVDILQSSIATGTIYDVKKDD